MKPYKLIKVPLFNQGISLFLTKESLDNKVKYMEVHSIANTGQVSVVSIGGVDYIVMSFINIEETTPEVISHESMHAAWRIMELVGIPVSRDTEEVAAYLTGYICNEVTKYYNKYLLELVGM